MTNKEILEKCIEKVVQNGYRKPGVTIHFYKELEKTCEREAHWYIETHSYFQVIFSHEFAEAFWGKETYYNKKPNQIYLYQEWYSPKGIMGKSLNLTEKEFIKKFNRRELNKIQKNNGGVIGKYEDWSCSNYWDRCKKEGWRYHLQRMILEKEPLKYLRKFL